MTNRSDKNIISPQELGRLMSQYNGLITAQALFFKQYSEVDDLIQTARVGAIKAFTSYDDNIGPLIPYLLKCVRYELLKFLKKEERHTDLTLPDLNAVEHLSLYDYLPPLENEEIMIIKYKLAGYSRNEISSIMNISLPLLNIKIHKVYDKIRKANEN